MSAKDLSNSITIPWFPGSEVTIRPMSVKDERMLLAFSDDEKAYTELVKNLVTPIKGYNHSDMDKVTRDYLLAKIRIVTYGDSIIFNARCPECGRENKNYKVSLMFPNHTNTLDEFTYEMSEKSSIGHKIIRLQNITVDKIAEIEGIIKDFRDANKEVEKDKVDRLCQALSLELLAYGLFRDYTLTEVKDFAESGKLSLYDLKLIMSKVAKFQYGMDTRHTFKCRNIECNHEWETELPILSGGFLVPCEC